MPLAHLYTDAGVFLKNPSTVGGAWAVVGVDDKDNEHFRESGFIECAAFALTQVENNLMETYAIAKGMGYLPDGWKGVVWCDNMNAIRRATNPGKAKMMHVPDWLQNVLRKNRERLPDVRIELVGGHPTKKELEAGRRHDGKIVSRWNVIADALLHGVYDTRKRLTLPGSL